MKDYQLYRVNAAINVASNLLFGVHLSNDSSDIEVGSEKAMVDADDNQSSTMHRCSAFSHRLPGEHVYDGTLFFGFSPPTVLDAVKDFLIREDDIFVVTYPKAGTTWIQEIVWLITHGADTQGANEQPIYFRSPFLEFKDDILHEVGLDLAATMTSPRIVKTHLPRRMMPKELDLETCKVVVLLRNPKDVCTSYYHFYKASSSLGNYSGSWEVFVEMFLQGHVDHGSWFEHTRDWWQERHRKNTLVVFYEHLKENLRSGVEYIAEFLGYTLSPGAIEDITRHCSFNSMKHNPMTNHDDVYSINRDISPFLRKGCVGDWKTHFTVAQSERVDNVYDSYFEGTGLSFLYSPPN